MLRLLQYLKLLLNTSSAYHESITQVKSSARPPVLSRLIDFTFVIANYVQQYEIDPEDQKLDVTIISTETT